MTIAATGTEVQIAYRKLKSYVYYDKTDLRLRERLAKFESSPKFLEKLKGVEEVADAAEPSRDIKFKQWLRQIDFRVVPKRLAPVMPESIASDARGKSSRM